MKDSSNRIGFVSWNSHHATMPTHVLPEWPGTSEPLLKALHILTRDGKINQDSRRKIKQVLHLVQLISPKLEGLHSVADLGAGKSYLGFMLYDLVLQKRDECALWAIEHRADLINTCQDIARQSGFKRIHFVQSSIQDATLAEALPPRIDAVLALHACDTATDEAIAFAIKKEAQLIALVPCCQAEVARLLDAHATPHLQQLFRHPIHRREFGSHLTNVMRSLILESRGYKVRVTELVGWEHAMKNELIIAEKVQQANAAAKRQLEQMRETFGLPMRLFDLTADSL